MTVEAAFEVVLEVEVALEVEVVLAVVLAVEVAFEVVRKLCCRNYYCYLGTKFETNCTIRTYTAQSPLTVRVKDKHMKHCLKLILYFYRLAQFLLCLRKEEIPRQAFYKKLPLNKRLCRFSPFRYCLLQ